MATNACHGWEDTLRTIMAAMALAVAFGFTPAMATERAGAPAVNASSAKAMIIAQRCRCVERRWNGSCKLRLCRDHW